MTLATRTLALPTRSASLCMLLNALSELFASRSEGCPPRNQLLVTDRFSSMNSS